jgi:hypothetical protein
VQNILIDNGSGEVMHIDFGIAFDQVWSLCVRPSVYSLCTGKIAVYPRKSAIPNDMGHGQWDEEVRDTRYILGLCRRNPACVVWQVRCHTHSSQGVQAQPAAFLVHPLLPPLPTFNID